MFVERKTVDDAQTRLSERRVHKTIITETEQASQQLALIEKVANMNHICAEGKKGKRSLRPLNLSFFFFF